MNRASLYFFMVPLLGVVAILQSVVVPRLAIGHVRPDVMVLVVVIWALLFGGSGALLIGFVAGLWMDLLSGGPMGGNALALMAVALVAGIGYNRFFRSNLLVPVASIVLGTLVYSYFYWALLALLDHRLPLLHTTTRLILPAVVYNGAIMLLLTPLLNRLPEQQEVG
ncbi:MAG: rod shape-determining protein MreD [Caldilineaceae bacterium]|nr:rod shape-determining protein MreD [Caldilineaceae bacterium]